jgi:multisubunit Na+/H+ antiporter MnhC subunit
MAGTPTRCGYCGRQTITRGGHCPSCGQRKYPPKTMEPPKPPSVWREIGAQIAAAAVTVLLIITAIVIGSQILLFVAILVLCAMAVLFVVANGLP